MAAALVIYVWDRLTAGCYRLWAGYWLRPYMRRYGNTHYHGPKQYKALRVYFYEDMRMYGFRASHKYPLYIPPFTFIRDPKLKWAAYEAWQRDQSDTATLRYM